MKYKSVLSKMQYRDSNILGTEGIHTKVQVWFDDDPNTIYYGLCVRYDLEEPKIVIIRLNHGIYILGSECNYEFIDR